MLKSFLSSLRKLAVEPPKIYLLDVLDLAMGYGYFFSRIQDIQRDLARDPSTALHLAIFEQDYHKANTIINELGPHLNHFDTQHGCPIHIAVEFGFESAPGVEVLLRGGADIEVEHPAEHMYTPIELAAAYGFIDGVKRLWDAGANRLGDKPARLSVLEIAAQFGHADLVQELLTWWSGWPIKTKESALHLAASRREAWVVHRLLRNTSFSQDILNKALKISADRLVPLDERDYGFGTEIDHARQRETLEQLLDAGADPNYFGGGRPLLRLAAYEGCPVRRMGTLLKYGAHPDASHDDYGTTVHQLVKTVSRLDDNPYDKALQLYKGGIEALLEYGASLRLLNARGESPFHDAARYGNVPLLQRLLHSDPEVRDEVGELFVGVANERQTMRQEQRDLFAPEMMYQTNDKLHKGALPFAANVATSLLFKPAATTPLRPLPRVMPSMRASGSFKSFHTLVPRLVKLGLRRRL